ncbi:hypothetical protein SAMN05444157_1608 [Frankineae bacterium MT45]|nr:hypothetical protein SAMN05444157_1608 [Frankineae bacterium MT45]
MSSVEEVLTAIDGALRDTSVGMDAMRWQPGIAAAAPAADKPPPWALMTCSECPTCGARIGSWVIRSDLAEGRPDDSGYLVLERVGEFYRLSPCGHEFYRSRASGVTTEVPPYA